MQILVIGKTGQLGQSINEIVSKMQSRDEFVFVGRGELDLSDKDDIDSYFENNNFDIIINCAAYTAVDKAESEIELADRINHLAIQKIATIANKQQIKLVHISTDYVFNGESDIPYLESDMVNPINIYGKTKLAGEQAVLETMPTDATIIRTSWVYSEYGNNFVDTMLRLGKERDELNVVSDQIGSPTYASDLAMAILHIIQNEEFLNSGQKTQIYHYSNEGSCSWFDFAKEIFELTNIQCTVNPITTEQYPTPTQRPRNTLMNKDKITKTFGINIPHWEVSLKTCIAALKKKQ
ncbi:MAG TPA: dTDP-4-dehydrorhamnose reductase [Gammaproteobacteria bacterium]|jgi:dTDP-4-dehydrorhamnose reductase|nr:dTDP-4-dehydrorhamnose reductase [Gammaproteobacteria bacterium]